MGSSSCTSASADVAVVLQDLIVALAAAEGLLQLLRAIRLPFVVAWRACRSVGLVHVHLVPKQISDTGPGHLQRKASCPDSLTPWALMAKFA